MTKAGLQEAVANGETKNPISVPLVDLRLQNARISAEIDRAIAEVLASSAFVLGPQVARFEEEFARYSEVAHCVGVGNGTDALELALMGARIGPGDDVVIPANTFVATAEAVVRTGANLVLADVTDDFLIDPDSVVEHLTPATRAVVAVHLYGQMAPMTVLAERLGPGVMLIEDAAQAQGARHNGRRAGSVGIAAGTSFYPGKNLGALGDAGAVMTTSGEIADRVRAMRNHGGVRRYEHNELGRNSRLDSIQAAVLSAKLQVLDDWNHERRIAARYYDELLQGIPEVLRPRVSPGNEHVWHLYVVRVPQRDRMLTALNSSGIGAGLHYPAPIHLLPAFRYLGRPAGAFPIAETHAGTILSLPIYPGITQDQQLRVVTVLTEALAR